MAFTLTMKYIRYQVQYSNVINHVTMPEKKHFGPLCKQVFINSNKIKAAEKALLWVILQWPVYIFLLKIKSTSPQLGRPLLKVVVVVFVGIFLARLSSLILKTLLNETLHRSATLRSDRPSICLR